MIYFLLVEITRCKPGHPSMGANALSNPRACLIDRYDDRLHQLAIASLLWMPGVALKELTREDAKSAVLYEAIYRYSTNDDPVDRANVVSKLIGPTFNEIADESWATPLANVDDAQNAASSDEIISAFLDVVSVSDYRVTMPCLALFRRSALPCSTTSVPYRKAGVCRVRSDNR